ncbi:MAG: hypothetical protein ACLFWF_08375 [Alphaproteobacteria bacterium]
MTIQTEAELLARLRKEYEAQNYALETGEALETPEGDSVRPDLVARKGGRTVLIAFRPYGGSDRDEARIRGLSELAAAREGWSFRLFLVEGPETALPEPPGRDDIAALLERARGLMDRGEGAIALMAAWSALEAAARLAFAGHGQRPKLFAGSALVKELIAHGYLGQDHLTRFHDLARKRDLAAHGYFRQPVEDSDVGAVIALAERLTGERARELDVAALTRRSGGGRAAPRR